MKQYTALALIFLLTIATPALAAKDDKNNSGRGNGNNKEQKEDNSGKKNAETREVGGLEVSVAPSTSPSGEPTVTVSVAPSQAAPSTACDPNANWKNHGQYVSCVAKNGGNVSEAARSDVGKKKKHNTTPTPSVSATPSAVPSISVVPSVSVVPSTSPSGEPTPSIPPITSAQEAGAFQNPIDAVIAFFQNAVNFFTNLKVV